MTADLVVHLDNLSSANVKQYLSVRAARAGVKMWDKPLHDLRKSCILDWARIQPSTNALKLWAGHASIGTTLKFYDKVRQEDMAVGQGRIFANATRPPNSAPNTPAGA